MKKYRLVACGGTFDRLHLGHKDFLTFAINLGDKVVLGLTSDLYIKKFKDGLGILSFEERKKELEKYLSSIQELDGVEIIPIDDHFGPTLGNGYPFDCLAVTESTKDLGATINTQRRKQGIKTIPLEIFKLTLAQSGKPITSTGIRNGEIDREGKLYYRPEWKNKNLLLPSTLREKLQDIWGELVQNIPGEIDSSKIVTVGDITTKKFINSGIFPFLAIIDNKVERKAIPEESFETYKKIRILNFPGTVSSKLFEAVWDVFHEKKSKLIIIDGEEDLAVLPVILAAPLGFQIFYGQPGKGMVQVNTSEEKKNKVRTLLEQFDIK